MHLTIENWRDRLKAQRREKRRRRKRREKDGARKPFSCIQDICNMMGSS